MTSIKSKVLLLLLTITAVVVLSMALLMKFGFNQGFSKYKKSLETELNNRITQSLQSYYETQQSWDGFVDDPRLWHELIFTSATDTLPYRALNKQRQANKYKSSKNEGQRPRAWRNEETNNNHDLGRVLPAYTLFNQQQDKVIGPAEWNQQDTFKIGLKLHGEKVGYLVYNKMQHAGKSQDKQFNNTIWLVLLMITGVMTLIVLLFTLPVSNYLTQPIRSLNQATQRAVAGDYSARTEIERGDELGQLGQNFNLLTSTLQSNAEIQKRIMADISHELRTPVSVLLAGIEAIQDGIHQADEKSLKLLHQQTNILKHLINDLHQLSVTDLGNMQYKMTATNLDNVLAQVIESLQLKATKRNIIIVNNVKKTPMVVFGDFNRLIQLFTNIINNSIEYTDQGGEVHISLAEQQGQIVVEIEDSAPGLLPDEMAQMFDRLYRKESSRNKKFGGSGLGLAISKNIVEAHFGEITAKASVLGGVHLTVRIPKHV